LITLHFIRHGETTWNVERRFQGQSDVPLTLRGREQAEELAASLADRPIGAIYSSDLSRALETARPLAVRLGLELVLEPRLRERNFGWAEGRTDDEVDLRYPRSWWGDPDGRIPGGESRRDVWSRVAPFLDELLTHPPATEIALVTHGGTIRVATGYLAQENLETLEWRDYAHISVTTVEVER
jgi:broad specificity phosphatase PhoE